MGDTTTGFQVNGTDIGKNLVDKSYLIDRYPELAQQYRFAGLWLWGANDAGQLGDNTSLNRSSPVITIAGNATWKQACSGLSFTAAIKTDGTLWLWGSNTYGQLGDNTITSKSSPVQTLTIGTNWKQVASGRNHTAAIKTDGTLWLWGRNDYGQLGDNTLTNRSSPVQTVAFGTNWRLVSAGGYVTAAIKTDGTLWTWGKNSLGQLGDNTTTDRSSPVQTVTFGTNWKQVCINYAAIDPSVHSIKTDGTLWSWGNGTSGQLGDNSNVSRSSPVQTVAGGTNWRTIGSSGNATVAIKTDGTLWVWGNNFWGQLGDNTTTNRSSPIQTITGGTNWKQCSGSFSNIAALKTDGTLWLWGRNNYGQLGDNTTTGKSSPIQTVAYGTNWKQLGIGTARGTTVAIKDDSEDLW